MRLSGARGTLWHTDKMSRLEFIVLIPLVVSIIWLAYSYGTVGGKARRLSRLQRLERSGIRAKSDFSKLGHSIAVPALLAGVVATIAVLEEGFAGGRPWVIYPTWFSLFTVLVPFLTLVANKAERAGRSWTGFFWLSLVISPLITGLIAIALKDEDFSEGKNAVELGKQSLESKLLEIQSLLDKGLISEADFEAKKKDVLGI